MKLSVFKKHLASVEEVIFQLPNGENVPPYFHITEVGKLDKKFIDCGGTIRNESIISIQLWESSDFEHHLEPQKILKIISISEDKLGITDGEIEVEYQDKTIGKYGLEFRENKFTLTSKATACLASDNCGCSKNEPVVKNKVCCGSEAVCC